METRKDLFKLFLKASKEYEGYDGIKYISELWNNRDKRISSTQLYTQDHAPKYKYVDDFENCVWYNEIDTVVYRDPEEGMQIIDERTKHEVMGCRNAIKYNLNLAREYNDIGLVEYYEAQLEYLESYLFDSLDRKGRIKIVNNKRRNHASLISHAVRKFYLVIQPKYPELVTYLNAHLVIGRDCYFSEEEIIKRVRKNKTA